MSFLSSCLRRKRIRLEDEEAPLIAQYSDETQLQRKLHQKMHSYQMIRAIGQGFLPSTEQLIINLRTLLASEFLNPANPDLSDQGQRFVQLLKRWLQLFIDLLKNKNSGDQLQDFLWCLTKARVQLDTNDLIGQVQWQKARVDSVAAFESAKTLASLMLTNSDFRLFLKDLEVVGRQILADTASSLSSAAQDTASKVKPSATEASLLSGPGNDTTAAPNTKELEDTSKGAVQVLEGALLQTGSDLIDSTQENFSGEAKDTTIFRLKQAILKLRKVPDYDTSVHVLSKIIKRYALLYSKALSKSVDQVQADVHTNDAVDKAYQNFWLLLTSFGDEEEWAKLKTRLMTVFSHSDSNPEFEHLVGDMGEVVESMLLDPEFLQRSDEKLEELKEKTRRVQGEGGNLRDDVDELTAQIRRTWTSVVQDNDVQNLLRTSLRIFAILSPEGTLANPILAQDCLHVFGPLLIQAIQYLPLPRLEVATPDVDLLLENLVLEPGHTVNHSSFLPFRLRIETQNNIEVRKARFRTHSSLVSSATVKLDGLTIRADEVGYWTRVHSGLARLSDAGIASFHLDDRGLDVHVDVDICRERLEQIITLRDVRVRIHHFNFTLRKSKLSWLTWILKPVLRPILRKTMERELSKAIAEFLHAANRELLFARERLRATRISEPASITTFFRAVLARLTPEEDPDLFTAFGVRPSGNEIFKGRYAPGSLVKLWEEEGRRARERVEDFEIGGWRNEIFDTDAVRPT